jgi:hypothetical protein
MGRVGVRMTCGRRYHAIAKSLVDLPKLSIFFDDVG